MSERTPVLVYASDPISKAGVAGQLRFSPGVELVAEADAHAVVTIVITDVVDDEACRVVRSIHRNGCARVVLVASRLDDHGVLAAIEAGACGLLRRADATSERLAGAVQSAVAGDGMIPPDLLGRLLVQVGSLQRQILSPRGIAFNGFTDRELKVLRLVAEGFDTAEIATRLAYSERTVKNVIHDITTRLQLRNRSHAVAYAVRQGFI